MEAEKSKKKDSGRKDDAGRTAEDIANDEQDRLC